MDNKHIKILILAKFMQINYSKSPDMTEENFWLMKSERVQLLLGSQGIVIVYSNFTQTFTDYKTDRY